MKIALLGHGQPRFTNAFPILMNQLCGFDQADFYFTFWLTEWAKDEQQLRNNLESYLLPKYQIKKVMVIEQPSYQLPNPKINHTSFEKHSVHWAYKRRKGMWQSLQMAFNLIDQDYDIVIKFRPDGRLDRTIDLKTLDMSKEMIWPSNHRNGHPGRQLCDQFLFATMQGMKFYSDMINSFDHYIYAVAPNWEHDIHGWASEHLMGEHLAVNNKSQFVGDYQHLLRVDGTSPNDDNWYRG